MTPTRTRPSDETNEWLSSVLTGIAIGAGFVGLYLLMGFLVAQWSIAEFFSYLTVETVLWLLVTGLSVIALFTIPVVLYQRYRLVSPIVLLTTVLLGWVGSGVMTGALFGLSLYLFGFAPVLIVLFVALGAGEYHLRSR